MGLVPLSLGHGWHATLLCYLRGLSAHEVKSIHSGAQHDFPWIQGGIVTSLQKPTPWFCCLMWDHEEPSNTKPIQARSTLKPRTHQKVAFLCIVERCAMLALCLCSDCFGSLYSDKQLPVQMACQVACRFSHISATDLC